MSLSSRCLAIWPLAPLALAAAGLLVLAPTPGSMEAAAPIAPAPRQTPTSFVPPALFLATAHVTGPEERYSVDSTRSRAIVTPTSDGGERSFTVSGSLRLLPDESIAALELELESTLPSGKHGRTIQVHATQAPSRHSKVPGLHVADLDARATLGGLPRPVEFAATWLRMPGGKLRVQAVADRFDAYDDWIAASAAPWTKTEHAAVSLILELEREREPR